MSDRLLHHCCRSWVVLQMGSCFCSRVILCYLCICEDYCRTVISESLCFVNLCLILSSCSTYRCWMCFGVMRAGVSTPRGAPNVSIIAVLCTKIRTLRSCSCLEKDCPCLILLSFLLHIVPYRLLHERILAFVKQNCAVSISLVSYLYLGLMSLLGISCVSGIDDSSISIALSCAISISLVSHLYLGLMILLSPWYLVCILD